MKYSIKLGLILIKLKQNKELNIKWKYINKFPII